MKKQNINNKLAFNKAIVTELSENQMHDIDGGTSVYCAATVGLFVWAIVVGELQAISKR